MQYSAECILLVPPFECDSNYFTPWEKCNLRVKPRRLPFILHSLARALAWCQFRNRRAPVLFILDILWASSSIWWPLYSVTGPEPFHGWLRLSLGLKGSRLIDEGPRSHPGPIKPSLINTIPFAPLGLSMPTPEVFTFKIAPSDGKELARLCPSNKTSIIQLKNTSYQLAHGFTVITAKHTLLLKSLGSLRNVLIFLKKISVFFNEDNIKFIRNTV